MQVVLFAMIHTNIISRIVCKRWRNVSGMNRSSTCRRHELSSAGQFDLSA